MAENSNKVLILLVLVVVVLSVAFTWNALEGKIDFGSRQKNAVNTNSQTREIEGVSSGQVAISILPKESKEGQ